MSESSPPPSSPGFSPGRFGLLLALLILAAFPQVILGIETFVARDFGFFVYPLAHFQKECFWRGELPFWNPYNNCGVPFLAQWNTMPLYPPSLIYLTLPLEWSLSFFSLFHLWFAGLGMYFLARRWTGSPFAAAFAGTAFAFNGFTLNLLMWPSHIATFSWLPWVVLAVEAAWREGGRKIPVAAFAGAMQMLAGGPETIFLTWLIVSALWLQQYIKADAPRSLMRSRFPLVVGLVFLLSAAQLFPFLDLVAHAQRATGYTDLRWSMPAFGLANFLVPMAFGTTATEGIFFQHGQYWTSSYYLSLATVWLALLAILGLRTTWNESIAPEINKFQTSAKQLWAACVKFFGEPVWLLAFLGLIALFCALGENTPFYPLVRKLIPQLSFITYPVKFVMVVIFVAPLLAAFALAKYFSLPGRDASSKRWERESPLPGGKGLGEGGLNSNFSSNATQAWMVGAILLTAIIGIIFWTQLAPLVGDDPHATLLNGISRAAFLVLTGAALFFLVRSTPSPLRRFAPLVLILVAWLDVFTHEPRQNPTVPPGIYQPNLVRTRLAMDPQPELGGSRAMLSPSAALELTRFAVSDPKNNFLAKRLGYCANVNLLDAVPKVDGFFSLTPRAFDGLLSALYSVTNVDWTGLNNFMGVSQYTAPTNFLAWEPRTNFLPLVTIGQKPVVFPENADGDLRILSAPRPK